MRHFQDELDELQNSLLQMAGVVESSIQLSLRALVERSEDDVEQVFKNEARINQMEIRADEMATRLMALHQPMARDLRFLTAAIKINADLERMGDLAVNIVQRALSLMHAPEVKPLVDIPRMGTLVQAMVRKSLDAFVNRDGDLARTVLLSDDAVDSLKETTYRELIEFMEADASTIPSAVDLIFVAHNLERIADHATNIAEDVLYLAKGIDVRHHSEG